MSSNSSKPVPATRKQATSLGGGQSIRILSDVIRLLAPDVTDEQRELEKLRLEKGLRDTEALIDRLVKEHQNDVQECLNAFEVVSAEISSCRKRVDNVRNALHTCQSLLKNQCDYLKQ